MLYERKLATGSCLIFFTRAQMAEGAVVDMKKPLKVTYDGSRVKAGRGIREEYGDRGPISECGDLHREWACFIRHSGESVCSARSTRTSSRECSSERPDRI